MHAFIKAIFRIINFISSSRLSLSSRSDDASEVAPSTPLEIDNGVTLEDLRKLSKKLIFLGYSTEGSKGEGPDGVMYENLRAFKKTIGSHSPKVTFEDLRQLDDAVSNLNIPSNLELVLGDTDGDYPNPKVSNFQKKLIILGYPLPRFGADGSFGQETLVAARMLQKNTRSLSSSENAFSVQGIGPVTYSYVVTAKIAVKPVPLGVAPEIHSVPLPPNTVVTVGDHPVTKGRGSRKLRSIKGVTLHQTACVLGKNPKRWGGVACHIGIMRDGTIVYNNDFSKIIWHGNGFNSSTIGIEIDGHFAGLEERNSDGVWVPNMKTYWRPKGSNRLPLSVTDAQVESCKAAIRWCHDVVRRNGGGMEHILAHRQSSPSRVSDPGQKIWNMVALPMIEELGLSDGGEDYYIVDSKGRAGKPIPQQWDPIRHMGVPYRFPKTSPEGRPSRGP